MTIAYFDCFSGISGDMCLGALIDAGVSPGALEKELRKIPLGGYRLFVKKVKRGHIAARKADVLIPSDPSRIRRWKDIEGIVQASALSAEIKQRGLNIFRRLFEAEAAVHGGTFRTVHLHEIGAVDCIVDVFGTVIALSMLRVDKVYSSPVNLGSGTITSDSGILPVPAPATSEILKNVPVYSRGVKNELTTPTGAAIIKELSSGYGDIPCMDVAKIGIGAGSKEFKDWPNVLRIFVGTAHTPPLARNKTEESSDNTITVIETNIDDMNPQIFDYVSGRLFKAGALDAYLTQVIMKKGRPAVLLTVLCPHGRTDELIRIIFEETTTIGVRFYEAGRKVLSREVKTIDTEFGKIRVKFSKSGDTIFKATPEFEDCRKIAQRLKIPLIDLMRKIKIQ